MRCVVPCSSTSFPWFVLFFGALLWGFKIHKHTGRWTWQGSASVESWNWNKYSCHSKLVSTLSMLLLSVLSWCYILRYSADNNPAYQLKNWILNQGSISEWYPWFRVYRVWPLLSAARKNAPLNLPTMMWLVNVNENKKNLMVTETHGKMKAKQRPHYQITSH